VNCSHTTNCATCAPLLAAEKARADDAEEACALHRENYLTVAAQRDAAVARAEKAEEEKTKWWMQACRQLADVAEATAKRDELGIQLAACQERLRLAMAVVDAARGLIKTLDRLLPYAIGETRNDEAHIRRAIAALDAVPGDVLAKVAE